MKIIKNDKAHFIQLTTMPKIFPINAYLILEDNFCTLIDCSKKGEGKKISSIIQKLGIPLKYIILTHAHDDHRGDISYLKEVFPSAQICLSETEAKTNRWKDNIQLPVDISLKNGDMIGSLIVVSTPGHTEGSISLYDTRTDYVFVGDLIQTRGGVAIAGDMRILFPFPGSATMDFRQNITSFENLINTFPEIKYFYCGHGPGFRRNEPKIDEIIIRAKNKI